MIALSLKLVLAHVIGDFVFQPDTWVEAKKKNKQTSPYLYWHLLVHTLALCIVLQFDTAYWKAVLIIVASHYLVDLSKLYLTGKFDARVLFFVDQLAHLSIIAGVIYLYEPYTLNIGDVATPPNLLLALTILLVGPVSAIIMKVILTVWSLAEDVSGDSLKDAGKYIGMLERLLVFVFIVLEQWSAIGFLITAKSVLRFSDISKAKDRKLTEYILIGTLLSFGLAILVGLCYREFASMIAG